MRLQGCCARSGVDFVQLSALGVEMLVGIFLCLVRTISHLDMMLVFIRERLSFHKKSVACRSSPSIKNPQAAFVALGIRFVK